MSKALPFTAMAPRLIWVIEDKIVRVWDRSTGQQLAVAAGFMAVNPWRIAPMAKAPHPQRARVSEADARRSGARGRQGCGHTGPAILAFRIGNRANVTSRGWAGGIQGPGYR